jgi:hypothetical protein
MTWPRIVVRAARYHVRDGFLVRHYKRPGEGHWAEGVFVESRGAAERCRAAFKQGGAPTREDMTA